MDIADNTSIGGEGPVVRTVRGLMGEIGLELAFVGRVTFMSVDKGLARGYVRTRRSLHRHI